MRALNKGPSAPKLWFYRNFGGGQGKGEAVAKLELEDQKLYIDVLKALQPRPKKPQEEIRNGLADLALTCQNAADRALALGELDIARRLISEVDKLLSSPLMRPPPDDRSDEQMTEEERTARARAWEVTTARRTILLVKQKDQIDRALLIAPGGSKAEAALTQQLAKTKGDQLMVGVQPADPFRAALSETAVRTAMVAMEAKVKGVVVPERQEAVLAKLGTKLTAVIDEMVREAVLKYMQNNGVAATNNSPGESYSVAMAGLLREVDGTNPMGAGLFRMFPGLQERIDLEATQFSTNLNELCDRIADDQDDLENDMFGGQAMKGLKDITVADSDPHNGGRRVTILKFEGTDGNDYKVVNKPRDVRVDAKFVGATGKTGMEASLSERATELMRDREATRQQRERERGKLLKLLQDELEAQNLKVPDDETLLDQIDTKDRDELANMVRKEAQDQARQMKDDSVAPSSIDRDIVQQVKTDIKSLPTYNFLDKEDDGGHRYGWVEFVEHGRKDDCVLDKAQAESFYQQSGQLAALSFLCGIEDIHQGNIMIRDGQPVLTDLEIAFSSKKFVPLDENSKPEDVRKYVNNKITNTMINKGLAQGTQATHDGNVMVSGDKIQQRNSETGTELTENSVFYEETDGVLKAQTEGMPKTFKSNFAAGFAQICDVFGDLSLKDDNEKFLDGFSGMQVRYHALATAEQLGMRRDQMHEGYTESIKDSAESLKEKAKTKLKSRIESDPWMKDIVESVASDLAVRDVAYYTQELGSKEVLHNGETPIGRKGKTDVLATDGIGVAKQNMMLMAKFSDIVKTAGTAIMDTLATQGELSEIKKLKEEMLK